MTRTPFCCRPMLTLVALGFLTWGMAALAQPPAKAPPAKKAGRAPALTKDQEQKLAEATQRSLRAQQLEAEGKLDEAVKVMESLHALRQEVFGEVHETGAEAQAWLARIHEQRGDISAVRAARSAVLKIRAALHPSDDWRVAEARFALRDVDRLARMTKEGRADAAEASRLRAEAKTLSAQGKYAEAEKLLTRAVALSSRAFGAEHPDHAACLDQLAVLCAARKEHARAGPLHRQAAQVMAAALGERHPRYAGCLHSWGHHYRLTKDLDQAVSLFERALAIFQQAFSAQRLETALTLNSLAIVWVERKDYGRAEPLYRQALDMYQRLQGEGHANSQIVAKNLAQLYKKVFDAEAKRPEVIKARKLKERDDLETEVRKLEKLGKRAEAIAAAEKMLALERAVLGNVHRDTAGSLQWLARLRLEQEDFAAAREAAQENLDICSKLHEPGYWRIVDARLQLAYIQEQQALTAAQRQDLRRSQELLARCRTLDKDKKWPEALSAAQEALGIRQNILGPDHQSCAAPWSWIASLQGKTKAGKEAVHASRLRELAICRKAMGDLHPEVGHVYYDLGVHAEKQGDSEKSADYYFAARKVYENTLGKNHRRTRDAALRLDNLATLRADDAGFAERKGDFTKAVACWKQAVTLRTGLHGPDDWETANARVALADMERMERLPPEERASLKDALARKRQIDDRGKAKLGEPASKIDEAERKLLNQQALADYQELLSTLEKCLGVDHPRCADVRVSLGNLHRGVGVLKQAEAFLRSALAIREKVLGERHPDCVSVLKSLASLYLAKEDYTRAEELYVRAIRLHTALREKEKNPFNVLDSFSTELLRNVGFSTSKTSIGGILERWVNTPEYFLGKAAGEAAQRGDFAKAIKLRHMIVALAAAEHGADHWSVVDARRALGDLEFLAKMAPDQRAQLELAAALANEAITLANKNEFAPSLEIAAQSLAIRRQLLGRAHTLCAEILERMALAHERLQQPQRAEECLDELVAIRRQTLGDKHNKTGWALYQLAAHHRRHGANLRAEPLYREALGIYEQEPVWDKSTTSTYFSILQGLAGVCHDMGAFAKAEPVYQQILGIQKQAEFKEAFYTERLMALAQLYLDWRRPELGLPLAGEAAALSRNQIEKFATGDSFFSIRRGESELDQLRRSQQYRGFLDHFLSLAVGAGPEAEAAGYTELLAWKGSVSARQHIIRVLFRANVDSSSPAAKAFADLQEATRRLAALHNPRTQATMEPGQLAQQMKELTLRVETAERDLAYRSGGFRAHLQQRNRKPGDLQKALPPDAVLFDFIRYHRQQPRPDGLGKGSVRPYLAAFVVLREGPISWIDLGPVAPLEKAVDAWRASGWSLKAGAPVRELLWAKLAPHIGAAKVVLLSPDDFLARLPWGALPGREPGAYLIEEVALALVPIPRLLPELLEPAQAGPPSLLLVGGADFDGQPGKAEDRVSLARSAPRPDGSSDVGHWRFLPGTIKEVEGIENLFRGRHAGGVLAALTGKESTEERVRAQAPKHRFLHFATHGYFAPRAEGAPLMDDRLLSGLVLAGANMPVRPNQDDGILTALEVEALDLSGVDMAVLSACETMLGKSAGGEGLLGLQRAFQVAGARTVVASLWQVPDRATQALMQRFYGNLLQKDMSKLEALREAQIWLLREGRKQPELLRGFDVLPEDNDQGRLTPRYWAAFVLSGSWR